MAKRMSRAEMEQTIIQGRAVVYRGRTYTRVQDLPSEAELAKGDPVAEASVTASLQEQMRRLQAQLDQVQAAQQPAQGQQAPAGAGTGRQKKEKAGEGEGGESGEAKE